MTEQIKEKTFFDHWWSMPVVFLGEFILIFGGVYLVVRLPTSAFTTFRAPEQKTETRSYTISTAAGASIVVTDLKSGTEFNRILQFPDGRVVVESGWVNHWGEDQIRIIGGRSADP
jgi:hypothetical protein